MVNQPKNTAKPASVRANDGRERSRNQAKGH